MTAKSNETCLSTVIIMPTMGRRLGTPPSTISVARLVRPMAAALRSWAVLLIVLVFMVVHVWNVATLWIGSI